MTEKISVISTIKNEKDSLQDFIRSIFEQSLKPDEVVVVDGGSVDGTKDVLEWLGGLYKTKLRYYIKPGFNISQGRNFAISHTQNNIVASVDGGATLQNDWLENLVEPLLLNNKIDVVSGFFIPEVSNTFEKYLAAVTIPLEEEMQDEKFLPSSRSIAFRKKAWKEVGGYPEWLPICEDLVFDIKLKNNKHNFAVNLKALSSWRPRENLFSFFVQYFKYARGDGHAKLFLRRHLIRYTTYITTLLLLSMAITDSVIWLAPILVGGIVYVLKFYNRFFRHFPKETLLVNFGSYIYIPFLVFVGDVAKMVGYPIGVSERIVGKVKFEEYHIKDYS